MSIESRSRLIRRDAVATQRLDKRHVTAAALTYATLEELFSMRSAPRLYHSPQCEIDASQRGQEVWNTEFEEPVALEAVTRLLVKTQ
jgi:hypothetical protein